MSATLPISASTRRMASVTATAGQTAFPYTFPLLRAEDIRVRRTRSGVITTLSGAADYYVTDVGSAAGGTVTLTAGSLAGDIIDIDGLAGLDRLTGVTAAGRFSSVQIDRDFDLALVRDQELRRDVNDLQAAPAITAFQENVEDLVGAMLQAGPGASVTYDDAAGKVTFAAIGLPGGGSGNVVGPASAVNNNIMVADGPSGRLLKDSGKKTSDFADAAATATALNAKADAAATATALNAKANLAGGNAISGQQTINGAVGIGPATTLIANFDISSNDGGNEGAELRMRGAPNGNSDYSFDVSTNVLRLFRTDKAAYSGFVEVFRADSDGVILFGTSNRNVWNGLSGTGLLIGQDGAFAAARSGGAPVALSRLGTDGSIVSFTKSGTGVGAINVTASATSYLTSSDHRLKENVVPLTGALARIAALPVHRFNFKATPGRVVDGFLAHEAAMVVPESVHGAKDEVDADGNPIMQGIDQSKLVPLLTAALQEAVAEITALKARVVALEARP